MRTTPIRAIAIAAGLLVAGCGADGGDPLTKAEFVEQANAICQTSADEAEPIVEAIFAGLGEGDPSVDGTIFVRWADAMDELVPLFEQQLDDIRALEPPADDQEFIETLLADQRAAIAEFDRLIDAAAAGDVTARAALDSDDDLFDDIDRRAREYGLTVCGEDG